MEKSRSVRRKGREEREEEEEEEGEGGRGGGRRLEVGYGQVIINLSLCQNAVAVPYT